MTSNLYCLSCYISVIVTTFLFTMADRMANVSDGTSIKKFTLLFSDDTDDEKVSQFLRT